jgi:hypothetical protein
MKTFQELLEAKKPTLPKFAKAKEYAKRVPDDKREYPEEIKEEIIRRLEPLVKHYDMEILDLRPVTYYEDYDFGLFVTDIMCQTVTRGKTTFGKFFNLQTAKKMKEFIDTEDSSCIVEKFNPDGGDRSVFPKIDIEEVTFEFWELESLIKNAKVDISSAKTFAQQWFFDEGPELEKFYHETRGARAAKKFGFKGK